MDRFWVEKKKAYQTKSSRQTPSISSFSKKAYEGFLAGFFAVAHKNTKPATTLAFLNADWCDFESTPAAQEALDRAITIFDFYKLLSDAGWETVRCVECPLSSERLSGSQVKKMQQRRILGTVGRTLLIARKNKKKNRHKINNS